MSSKGVYIKHKNNEYTKLKENIFSLAETRGDVQLKELGEKMISNKTGFEEYYSYSLSKKCFVFYAPLKETGWSIGIVIPKDEPFADLHAVAWNLFAIGAVGYTLVLGLIIILLFGFALISNFFVRNKFRHL